MTKLGAWWAERKLWLKARTVVRLGVAVRGAPVIAVTGTNGKTTTVHLIDRMLRAAGYKVGTCTTYGVYHNGQLVSGGDKSGHRGVWRALHCPGLQVIVAEVGRGGMLRYGTGFVACQVGVVTNIFPDHLGLEGIENMDQMATAKSEIVRRTHPSGTVVLNADDDRVRAMAAASRAPVSYFTVAGRESEFQRGWFLRDGWLWRKNGREQERLIAGGAIPVTLGGQQVHNVANALGALAAIEGISNRLPVSREAQLAALHEYGRQRSDYPPGRYVLTRFRGHYVLIMHCKNPDGYRVETPMIQRIKTALGCRYLAGVASSVTNRREEYHRAISKHLATLADGVFLRRPVAKFLRGMDPTELIRRMSAELKPGQLLSTEPLSPADTLAVARQRFGESCLLVYFVAVTDPELNLEEFLREAEVVPLPAAAMTPDVSAQTAAPLP